MSASDHLSKNQFRLFHGTNVDIPKGEHIYPGDASENDEIDHESGKHVFDTPRSRWGEDLAFASTNLHDASQYGKNIYEVSVDKDDDKLEYHGSEVYGHPGGFAIKRQIPNQVVDRYKKLFPEK